MKLHRITGTLLAAAAAGGLLSLTAIPASASTAPSNYSYATAFDTGSSAPVSLTENFLIRTESLKDRTGGTEDNHSLTETYVMDAAGNAFEFGVTSDTFDPTTAPTLFTTAWTRGSFDGYQAGFVSTSPVVPGTFRPPVGSSPQFGYSVSQGTVTLTYNGAAYGHIPASFWGGKGFGAGGSSQTYGEVWNTSPGGKVYPDMNGTVSNYHTSSGSHLGRAAASIPYGITATSGTGFTFAG